MSITEKSTCTDVGDPTHEPPIFQLNPKQNEIYGGGWISNRGYGFSAPIWPWWLASTEREQVQIVASWASNTSSWVYIYIYTHICRSNKFFRAKSMPIHGWTGRTQATGWSILAATQSGNLNAMEICHLFHYFYMWCTIPIGSMYGIFTYIWVIHGVNVGKYSSTMDPSWDYQVG